MRAVVISVLVAWAAVLTGCASVSIRVEQFRGEFAHSARSRLAEARGEANAANAIARANPRLLPYFDQCVDESRTPANMVARINEFADYLWEDTGTYQPETAGLPRRLNLLRPDPGEDPDDQWTRAYNERIDRELSALEKELREFGAFLIALDVNSILSFVPTGTDRPKGGARAANRRHEDSSSDALRADVARLQRLGASIVNHTEYPDFAELAHDDSAWELINPVETFGGLGASEFVIVKDDTGNFVLKSAAFDPSDVIKAASSAATNAIATIATIDGVPLTSKDGQGATTETGGEAAVLRAEAGTYKNQIAGRRNADRRLASAVREAMQLVPPLKENENLDEVAFGSCRERMLAAVQDYLDATMLPEDSKSKGSAK